MKLYLEVPFSEKEEAKLLGAKWDCKVKRWYVDNKRREYAKYAKWILKNTDDTFIMTDYIMIVEGKRKCWKCGAFTRVIGLGIGEFINVYGDVKAPHVDRYEDNEDTEELHLAWSSREEDIPPRLLRYLKENYNVRTAYSQNTDSICFANHCDYCDALQGNFYLFDEPDSVLSSCVEEDELIDRMSKLKIIGIPIEDDLQLDWEVGFCQNDYAYMKYGKYEEISLSDDSSDEDVTYEELYDV